MEGLGIENQVLDNWVVIEAYGSITDRVVGSPILGGADSRALEVAVDAGEIHEGREALEWLQ